MEFAIIAGIEQQQYNVLVSSWQIDGKMHLQPNWICDSARHRKTAMQVRFFAQDCPHLQCKAKELAGAMSSPTVTLNLCCFVRHVGGLPVPSSGAMAAQFWRNRCERRLVWQVHGGDSPARGEADDGRVEVLPWRWVDHFGFKGKLDGGSIKWNSCVTWTRLR